MLKIRLRRMGAKHRPFYRVVVSESSRVPQSAFVENVGHYDPLRKPPALQLDVERIDHWIGQGARPSERVKKLMRAFAGGEGAATPKAEATTQEAAEPPKTEAEAEPAPKAEEKTEDGGDSEEE